MYSKPRKQAVVSIMQLVLLSYLFCRAVLNYCLLVELAFGGTIIIPPLYDAKGGSLIIYLCNKYESVIVNGSVKERSINLAHLTVFLLKVYRLNVR